jgi:hypothetical protein
MPYLLQLGGALKNPLAVGAGMIEGMGFGINTMAERATPSRAAPRRMALGTHAAYVVDHVPRRMARAGACIERCMPRVTVVCAIGPLPRARSHPCRARHAYVTRSCNELTQLCVAMGGKPQVVTVGTPTPTCLWHR